MSTGPGFTVIFSVFFLLFIALQTLLSLFTYTSIEMMIHKVVLHKSLNTILDSNENISGLAIVSDLIYVIYMFQFMLVNVEKNRFFCV